MDDDQLDGCQAVLEATEYDDEATVALRPLFPRGMADARLADDWVELFGTPT